MENGIQKNKAEILKSKKIKLKSLFLKILKSLGTVISVHTKEEEETAAKFQKNLNVDNDVAKILAEEGFTSVDEIALCEIEELENINGFDKELVSELRKRAIDEYEIQQKEIDDKNSLSNLDDLTDDQVTLLRNSDILSINDVADLSIDELLDIIDISNETAGKIIMQARESWFDEENDGQR